MDPNEMVLEDRLSHFIQWLAERDVHLVHPTSRGMEGLNYDQIEGHISSYVNE